MLSINPNVFIGGALIGISAVGMLWSIGKILGVSGIFSGALSFRKSDFSWRFAFILGVMAGALMLNPLGFGVMSLPINRSLVVFCLGGFLVGFGSVLANGCTSGHGICGVARLSPRSIVATTSFLLSGLVTASLIGWLFGGSL